MEGAPVFGSRTWIWAIAAPALAASIAALAICSGVIGRSGCCAGLVMLPVTAQVMMVLSAIARAPSSCAALSMALPRDFANLARGGRSGDRHAARRIRGG